MKGTMEINVCFKINIKDVMGQTCFDGNVSHIQDFNNNMRN